MRPWPNTTKAGSSPHTRGALLESVPAVDPCWDHPRIRGEHDTPLTNVTPFTGSSPHTRGALFQVFEKILGEGIIPAYAGSTSPFSTSL